MSKILDWNEIATVNFDDRRRKAQKTLTGREMFAKAYENLQKSEEALARRQVVEPLLRNALLAAMVSRVPITVTQPINNPTESLGGIQKGGFDDDDDGFYNSTPNHEANAIAQANVKFEEVMEMIPPGTQLMFKSRDPQLGQLVFRGSNGREYSIYEHSQIMFKGSQIENPGLYGLLFATNLIDQIDE